MPQFQFALTDTQEIREAGVGQTDTFSNALLAISVPVTAHAGDRLEIGVPGFPPARYECVWSAERGAGTWRPAGLLAA